VATDAERKSGKKPKVIAIGGEPATGKTYLVRALMPTIGPAHDFKYGLIQGTFHACTGTYIVGKYKEGDVFAGTDKLSMSAQKDWPAFLEKCALERRNVIFEGDRLFIQKNLTSNIVDVVPIFLIANHGVKLGRHLHRRDSQTPVFLKGRQTKYERLLNDCVRPNVFAHENRLDTERILLFIKKELNLL
jgi:hypothetical protein